MVLTNHIDEKDLLLRLQNGDHTAFEILYQRHSRQLLAKLDRKLATPDEADDLIQELFIKIWERRHQIDPEQDFAGYLYRIGQRMVTDHYRKLARTAILHERVQLESTESINTLEDQLAEKETRELIQQAIEQLPKQQQRAFNLCKIEGKSYKEAAEIMDISPETVHVHLVKATQTVKSYFQKAQYQIPGVVAVMLLTVYQ
jgi:RNA polymerase sigma-70 factor (family 1)